MHPDAFDFSSYEAFKASFDSDDPIATSSISDNFQKLFDKFEDMVHNVVLQCPNYKIWLPEKKEFLDALSNGLDLKGPYIYNGPEKFLGLNYLIVSDAMVIRFNIPSCSLKISINGRTKSDSGYKFNMLMMEYTKVRECYISTPIFKLFEEDSEDMLIWDCQEFDMRVFR
jgi:hypothetical protein